MATFKARYNDHGIQGFTQRGEPRQYYVYELVNGVEHRISRHTRDHRQAARWLKKLEADGTPPPQI